MHKVFFNEKPLILTTHLEGVTNETPLLFAEHTTSKAIINALKSKKVSKLFVYHKSRKKLTSFFIKRFPIIEAAGGLVQHQDGTFLMIYRNDKWDLPKGKIEKAEDFKEGAIREVEEETGVCDLKILKDLPPTYHIFSQNGRYKLKRTYWYFMSTDYAGKLKPQKEENIQKAKWKSKQQIPELLDNAYPNIKILFKDFI